MAVTRVALVGLGATGCAIGTLLAAREDCVLVGAVDQRPDTIGRDLSEFLGLGRLGIAVTSDLGALPATDLAVVATTSDLDRVAQTVIPLLERSINVVSICEQLAYPWESHPQIAKQLDAVAREHGVTVVGTGANPGVLMDTLPMLMSVLTRQVNRVVIRRRTNMSRYGAILSKFGLGLEPTAFAAARNSGQVIGHVGFEQAIGALAAGLGWELDTIVVDDVEPSVVSDRRRQGAHTVIEPGAIAAVTHRARGLRSGDAVIDLEIVFGFFDAEDEVQPGDEYLIEGDDQLITLASNHGFESFLSTVAAAANVATAVVDAPAGLHSMGELPVLAMASKGARIRQAVHR
ncbi:dihydrodipicolinate reductase [Prauserella coralliicola]|nr:dihydrodipicolinate reductase [Prauserella coralliicola]